MVVLASQAAAVLARLGARDDERLQRLSAVATRDLLVIVGPEQELPWLDGARYCAPDPLAPELWLPTHTAPGMPLDLVQTALLRRVDSRPLLLWNAPEQILPLSAALPLSGTVLAWLDAQLNGAPV
jgi:hypothetical protein